MSNIKKIISHSILVAECGILTCIFITFFSLNVSGQKVQKYRITKAEIPGSNIRCLSQDSKGFLWVGTQDGLFKFDSKNAKQFNKKNTYENNIGGSDIRDLVSDQSAIWITSTQGGIDKIDIETSYPKLHIRQDLFKGLNNNTITSLLKHDSCLFIGTEKGLYRYNSIQNTASKIEFAKEITSTYVDKLAFFENFLIIFFRNWGCISYNVSTAKTSDKLNTLNDFRLESQRFFSIAPLSENSWLLGTSAGLCLIEINKNGQLNSQKRPFSYASEAIDANVYGVTVDRNKNVWFSTGNNLFKIETKIRKCFIIANTLENTSDFLNNIYKIYCDSQNNIWLGCQVGLFYLKNLPAPTITFYRSTTSLTKIAHAYYLYPINDSIVFVTAENGIYRVNTIRSVIEEIDVTQVYDFIFTDPYQKLIVSNETGLKILLDKKIIPIQNFYKEFQYFNNYTINSAVKINDSEIVMGTENNRGILIWDFINHSIKSITTSSNELKIDNNITNGIFKIKENIFCVLTESSVIYIDWKKKTSHRLYFVKNNPSNEYGLFFDMCKVKNHYYLSTYGNGVLVLDTNFQIKRTISTADGLSNNSIYKLLPWKDSLLFMTTNFGLNILNVKTERIQQLYKSDGLHDNTFEETSGNIYNNLIYAGGQKGFTIINPENLQPNKFSTILYIDKVSFNLSNNTSRDTSNFSANKFFVPNNILQTNIYFSGINYSNPERTTYSYRILELQKNWINIGSQNFVTLIGLPPKTYTLQVQAFNEDGVPSEIKMLTLIFLPKWYQTWWFRVLIILAVAAIFFGLYKFRINHLKKEEKIRNQVAGDLHDELGSTLNSVKIFTSLALMEKDNTSHLEKIKEATQLAIAGVKDIIWVLDDKRDTLDHLLGRINQFARPICEAAGISYKQQSGGNENYKLGKEEKRNLYMIIKESINNSIKYAECSVIELLIKNNGGKLSISISDDGKGFDKNEKSSGYGLRNIKHRAGEIGYHAEINSSLGNGTLIYLEKK